MNSSEEATTWVKELTGLNFVAVYDVLLDVSQELQLSENVVIPILPSVVRFQL
jgi:hypothetical protein